jgi:hypothetical protein
VKFLHPVMAPAGGYSRRRLAWAAISGLIAAGSAHAQSRPAAWSSTLLVPGTPSPFISEWERNPQLATLVVTYAGRTPTSYTIAAQISGDKRRVISTSTSGPYPVAFGPTTQLISSTQLNCFAAENVKSFVEQIVRTGMIPEDRYTLTVRVLENGKEVTRALQVFTISLPEAPRLLYPGNGSSVRQGQPLFQWTPVAAPLELGVAYQVKMAEINPGQTADAALRGNRLQLDQLVQGSASLLYPIDALPLREGSRYVWRVNAVDGSGQPFTSARSTNEEWVFTREAGLALDPRARPDSAVLIPGLAVITGLNRSTRREETGRALYSGRAQLKVRGSFPFTTDVTMTGIALDVASLPDGEVVGGTLAGSPTALNVARVVKVDRVAYGTLTGLRLSGTLAVPGLRAAPLGGTVELTAAGLSGTLTATGSAANPLGKVASGAAALVVTAARVVLPAGTVQLTGSVQIFGKPAGCDSVSVNADSTGRLTSAISCLGSGIVPLVGASPLPGLRILRVEGGLTTGAAAAALTPKLSVTAALELDKDTGTGCSGMVTITIDGTRTEAVAFTPTCEADNGTYDLGGLGLRLSNLSMDHLRYTSAAGFDFAFAVDAQPELVAFPNLRLPALLATGLTPAGLAFGAMDAPIGDVALNLQGYVFRPRQATAPATVRPWTTRDSTALRITLAGTVSLPALGGGSPSCLATPVNAVGTLAERRMDVAVEPRAFGADCDIALGGGTLVRLDSVSGSIRATIARTVTIVSGPQVRGSLVLPAAFVCGASERVVPLGSAIALGARGQLTVRTTLPDVRCPFTLPSVSLTMERALLTIAASDTARSAAISGGASGIFSGSGAPVKGNGSLAVDLIAGRVQSGLVTFEGPFVLGMPASAPTFQFSVPAATLDTAGVHIDGRGKLALSATDSIGATFVKLDLDLATLAVRDGRVNFDDAFALGVGVAADGALRWRAMMTGATPGAATDVRMDLPSGLALDVNGLAPRGAAAGAISYDSLRLQGLSVVYSSDLALGAAPFGVSNGTIEVRQGLQRLAVIDGGGFHADRLTSVGAGLPDRLPLPSVDVAYLDLSATNVIDARVERRADGSQRISTLPGRTLPLRIPALGGVAGVAVPVAVDIVLDVGGALVQSGTISSVGGVTAPDAPSTGLTINGLAFAVDSLSYFPDERTWSVGGRPVVFGAARGANGAAHLVVAPDGALNGTVAIAAPATIVIAPGARRLAFLADSVRGVVGTDASRGIGGYAWDVVGALELRASDTQGIRTPSSLTVTPTGVTLSSFTGPTQSRMTQPVVLGGVAVMLSEMRVPRLNYVANSWDYEVLLNAGLTVAQLSSTGVLSVADVTLDRNGLHVPAFAFPELQAAAVDSGTFTIRPLALRSDGGTVDWFGGAAGSDWPLSTDVEVRFPNANAPLRDVHLSVLDARMRNGQLGGNFEPLTLPSPVDIALGADGASLRVSGLAGVLAGGPAVTLAGSLMVANALRCAANDSGEIPLTAATLALSATGVVSGTARGVTLPCGRQMGGLGLRIADATITVSGAAGSQTAALAGTASVTLPTPAGDSLRASGPLTVDFATLRPIAGALAINGAFRWSYPVEKPVMTLSVRSARLDAAGLTFLQRGALYGGTDSLAAVTYNELVSSLPSTRVSSGSMTLTDSLALHSTIGAQGALTWQPRPRSSWDVAGDQLRVVLPPGAVLDSSGLASPSGGGGRVTFTGREFADLGVAMVGAPRFVIATGGMRQGSAVLMRGADTVGTADRFGFVPGGAFDTPAMPRRLGLPTESVAYIELQDAAGTSLVQVFRSGSTTQLIGLDGKPVQMVVPALAVAGKGAPSIAVTVDVTIDPKTFNVLGGSIDGAVSPGTFLGGPLDIRRLTYADSGRGFALRASGQLAMPGSLKSLAIEVSGVRVTAAGLVDSVSRGATVSSDTLAPVIASAPGTTLALSVVGMQAVFNGASSTARLVGYARTPVFARALLSPTQTRIPLEILLKDTTVTFTVGGVAGATLPQRDATFEPAAIDSAAGLSLVATSSTVSLVANGVLRFPNLNNVAFTLTGLRIEPERVTIDKWQSGTGKVAPGEQLLTMFGAPIKLDPAKTLVTYDGTAIDINAVGVISIYGLTGAIKELHLRTDGRFSETNLVGETPPQNVVSKGSVKISTLRIVGGKLVASFVVQLPTPLVKAGLAPLTTDVTFGADGTPDRTRIVLRDELLGMTPPATMTYPTGVQMHTRLVLLTLAEAAASGGTRSGQVDVVADVYLRNMEYNRIFIGNDLGGVVKPGYSMPFVGKATWQNIIASDTVSVNIAKIAELQVARVNAASGEDFNLQITGYMGLNFSPIKAKAQAATGGLGGISDTASLSGLGLRFSGLGLMDGGLDFANFQVQGGMIALLNGAMILDVQQVSFSDKPSTIQVIAPPPPPGQMPSQATFQTIAVNSNLSFGGRICVAKPGSPLPSDASNCIMAGGMDRLLLYEETATNRTTFVINKANVKVKDMINLELYFRYTEVAGGAGIAFAGSGVIAQTGQDIIAAGQLEIGDDDLRIGAFLTVQTAIRVGPVLIEKVGGGFFWRPTQAMLTMVRNVAIPGDGKLQLSSEPAQFAVFLFGEASIIAKQTAQGRVLLMLTDRLFRMDGTMVLLGKPNQMSGRVSMVVGFKRGYTEGTIDMIITQPDVFRATSTVAFYAYDANAWGIQGDARMVIFPSSSDVGGAGGGLIKLDLEANGSFFIGPRGFMATFKIERTLSFVGIINAKGGWRAIIWYYTPAESWGMYAAIDVSVDVVIATARGSLEGALVFSGTTPKILMVGTIGVSTFFGSWSGSVWASLSQSGTDGGFGRDAALDAALANAKRVRADIETSRIAVTAAIADAKTASAVINLTDEQLLSAYGVARQNVNFGSITGFGYEVFNELSTAPKSVNTSLLPKFFDVLVGKGAPQADSITIRGLKYIADSLWTSVRTQASTVDNKLRNATFTLKQVSDAALAPNLGSPVSNESISTLPQSHVVIQGGDTLKVIDSGPGFDVDPVLAARSVTALTQYQSDVAGLAAKVLEQAKGLGEGLGKVRAAATGASGSIMTLMSAYDGARVATERLYAEQFHFLGAAAQYNRDQLAFLSTNETDFATMQHSLALVWRDSLAAKFHNPFLYPVPDFASARTAAIAALTGDPSLVRAYNAAATDPYAVNGAAFYIDRMDQTGKILYLDIPRAGMNAALVSIDSQVLQTRVDRRAHLGPIELAHAQFTAATDSLFQGQVALGGVVYDLYDRYRALSPKSADSTDIQTRLGNFKTALEVPKLNLAMVSTIVTGWTSEAVTGWAGVHPTGVYEYLHSDGGPMLSGGGGSQGSYTEIRSYLDAPTAPLVQTFKATVSVRAGLGTRASLGSNYTITYPATSPVAPGAAQVVTSGTLLRTDDKTPPSTPLVTIDNATVIRKDGWARPVAWALPSSRLVARWSATDAESGIGEYSFALGTKAGASDISPWEVMGGRTERLIDGSTIGTGRSVYVSVKAKNGAGLPSLVGSSMPLRIDATPPTIQPLALWPLTSPASPTMLAQVVSACNGRVAPQPAADGVTGSFVLLKPPVYADSGSGVAGVYWKLAAQAATSFGGPGWTLMQGSAFGIYTNTKISGEPLGFAGTTTFLNVAVVDNVGGSTVTSMAVSAVDPTLPAPPVVCAVQSWGNLAVRVDSPGSDPESGLLGVQTRVTNAVTGAVLKDWPAGKTVVPGSHMVGKFPRGAYWVDVRSMNGQGMTSPIIRSGPVFVDNPPPPPATITVTKRGTTYGEPEIYRITAPADPKSGLMVAWVRVGDTPNSSNITADREILTMNVPFETCTATFATPCAASVLPSTVTGRTLDQTIVASTILPPTWKRDMYVTVTMVNHAGLTTVTTQKVDFIRAR